MIKAKELKHEADEMSRSHSGSGNRERLAMKYLEAVLYFILCGSYQEVRGDHTTAYTIYKETLNMLRLVTRPLRSCENKPGTPVCKLTILSLRCQSLLYLRLFKLRQTELRECQQKLEDLLNIDSKNGLLMSPIGSPTPSPAGSEESGYSKSSGYTSSGEHPFTPASSNSLSSTGGNMSVPHILMHQHVHYSHYLTQCHELWEMAELHQKRGQCQGKQI